MAGRGGARPNSGRKKKYEDLGQEKQTRPVHIPEDIPDDAIEAFVKQYLKSLNN